MHSTGSIFNFINTGDRQSVLPSLSAVLTYLLVVYPVIIGVLVCCFLIHPAYSVADCVIRGALLRTDIIVTEQKNNGWYNKGDGIFDDSERLRAAYRLRNKKNPRCIISTITVHVGLGRKIITRKVAACHE